MWQLLRIVRQLIVVFALATTTSLAWAVPHNDVATSMHVGSDGAEHESPAEPFNGLLGGSCELGVAHCVTALSPVQDILTTIRRIPVSIGGFITQGAKAGALSEIPIPPPRI